MTNPGWPLNIYRPLTNEIPMKRSHGNPSFPVWLIADSEPSNTEGLEYPLDPKHPARHNIWTSVEHYLQRHLYQNWTIRLNTDDFYIRNAFGNPETRPTFSSIIWEKPQHKNVIELQEIIKANSPRIIITFGSLAFETARRALNEEPYKMSHWNVQKLGDEFRKRTSGWNNELANIYPLLHVSIARGKFLSAHRNFMPRKSDYSNYFQYVGESLAEIFRNKLSESKYWF